MNSRNQQKLDFFILLRSELQLSEVQVATGSAAVTVTVPLAVPAPGRRRPASRPEGQLETGSVHWQ